MSASCVPAVGAQRKSGQGRFRLAEADKGAQQTADSSGQGKKREEQLTAVTHKNDSCFLQSSLAGHSFVPRMSLPVAEPTKLLSATAAGSGNDAIRQQQHQHHSCPPSPLLPSSESPLSAVDPALEELWQHAESSWLRESAAHSSDGWVWQRGDRDRLLPLSGAVPFNGEPTLSDLFSAGIVTPTPLHHVRNHGPTPCIDAQAYRLQVCADDSLQAQDESKSEALAPAVRMLREWSLSELQSLPSTTLLVSITCDGIRRKELNQLQHTKGINTGPAATGTSRWTGVLLTDLLRCSGIHVSDAECTTKKYPFVAFDGLDSPAKGTYGTSLPAQHALDTRSEVLLAWAQNGEALTPDHGAPLRLVVPGFVGGRHVKWLGRVLLGGSESRSVYHTEDNVLPPSSVTLAEWNSGRLFGKPEQVLYEQLVNSTIARPAHEEWLRLEQGAAALMMPVHVEGFASAGGGRRVLRVEISADGGCSWLSANIRYADVEPESPAAQQQQHHMASSGGGEMKEATSSETKAAGDSDSAVRRLLSQRSKCWSWCFWRAEVPAWQLLGPSSGGSKEIVVRAFDESFNTQHSSVMQDTSRAVMLPARSPSLSC